MAHMHCILCCLLLRSLELPLPAHLMRNKALGWHQILCRFHVLPSL
jgi:hypothetical protein